jgi:ATP-dependent HslUV protease ATP-binding subunit HslU
MERLLESISFEASELTEKKVVVDAEYVNLYLQYLVEDDDLSRYIL